MTTRVPIRPNRPDRPANPRLEASLAAWLGAGLIGPDQADSIRSFESVALSSSRGTTAAVPKRRVPIVAEALGYLGGMLAAIGVILLAARYWSDVGTAGRLGGSVAVMVALTVAGHLVPHRGEAALERLRALIWLGGTAAAGLAAGVFMHDEVLDADRMPLIVLAGATAVTAHSIVLWWHHDRPAQQATFLVGALVMVGTAVSELTSDAGAGLAVWSLAAVLLVAGLLRRTTRSLLTVGIGAAGVVVGAALTQVAEQGSGLLFAASSAAALLAIAGTDVTTDSDQRVVLGIIGLVGMVQSGPQTVAWFGRGAGIATGLTVVAVGVTLLLAARRPAVTAPITATLAGGALLVAGGAITGMASVAFATTFGLTVALVLLVLGTLPEHALMTIFGCLGLLVNVPWAISHFFPGEGRAPLLIAVSGALIVLVAVWLAHQGGELRHQFRRQHRRHSA